MVGQGGPRASWARTAPFARRQIGLCSLALVWLLLAAIWQPLVRADEVNLKLRIAWGGGAERIWHGSVRLSNGEWSGLSALGIEADEPGSIWIDGSAIEIRQRSPRAYDGVDVKLTADLEAQLTIALANDNGEPPTQVSVPLRTLVQQTHSSPLDDVGNRLTIARAPGDRLRVETERDALVFSPGELFPIKVEPYLVDQGANKVRLLAHITSNPAGQSMWHEEYEAGPEGTDTAITLRVPEIEGVYDLTISATTPSGRIGRRIAQTLRKPLAERKIQFVVLEPRPAPSEAPATLTKVVEINPMNPRWWERFANLPLMPGLRKGPLGNGDAAPWEHPALGAMIQLGPGGTAPNLSWEAYPLPINQPGQAHVLEVEYPSDVPQAMGISLIEPNAAGAVVPIGLDSGVYVSDEEAESVPALARHRIVFWPRTKTPLVLITNRRQGARVVHGRISVLTAPPSQFSMLALGRTGGGSVLPPAFPDAQPPERLWAGYLDRPLVAENFSALEALDPTNRRSLDDWNTFYQGAGRLVTYARHVGLGGMMLSVYADGSAIYPSQVLQPTPRYDTGVFFTSGQDPRRKDVLEVLFRMFDREQLTLIPALQFAAPLPALEELRRQAGPESDGLEWIGADGRTWLATQAAQQGLAPYYNVLNPRVQEAMLAAVRELTVRYAAHESFGGVSLQLCPEGFSLLPGEDWGYDDLTIAQFERDTKLRVPASGTDRFAARSKYLTGPGRAAWLQWRAAVLAGFHRRLRDEVEGRHQGAKLYLAGGTMLDNRQTQLRLRPTLPRSTTLEEALLELGIRPQDYRDQEGLVLLRPQTLRPQAMAPPSKASDWESWLAPGEADRLFAGAHAPGSLFYHEPQKARLSSFDAKSPFGTSNTHTWLVSQFSPSGDRNRRRFIHALATLDAHEMFDGGWLLPLGQEDSLREVLATYRQLPAQPFKTLAGEFQPLTIRTLSRGGQSYIYLVNDSAWEVGATLTLDLPSDCHLEKLGESRASTLTRSPGSSQWQLTLRPYDLVAARFSSPRVTVRQAQVTTSEQVTLALQRRIRDLSARVRALGTPMPLAVLENPNFELPPGEGDVPGWSAEVPVGGTVQFDAQHKAAGAQSLKLTSNGPNTRITSGGFSPPATGRVAVEVRLRASHASRPPSVRIFLEGEMGDARFERHGVIPAVGAGATTPGEWMNYSFPIGYLPQEGLDQLRIGIELIGAGEVWVDDVQIFDLAFEKTERYELSKLISLASVVLEKRQLADCAQLLEGYWPQFLVANVPLAQSDTTVARTPAGRAQVPAPPAKKSTVLENLKEYLPRIPLR